MNLFLPVFFAEIIFRIDARIVQRDDAAVIVDRPLGRGDDPDVFVVVGKETGAADGLGADAGRSWGHPGGNETMRLVYFCVHPICLLTTNPLRHHGRQAIHGLTMF